MADLRLCFEGAGFRNVTTYIQSGNVLFESRVASVSKLANMVEQALCVKLIRAAQVVIVSCDDMERVVADAPPGFGGEPHAYLYDVAFVRPPSVAKDLLAKIPLQAGVDIALERHGVIYLQRLIAGKSQSKLHKLSGTAAAKSMTIRNWNTTSKLHELMCRPPKAL